MKRIFRHIRRTRAAFTLMEVNLAIFIMAVGVLAMTALYPLGFRESEQSRDDVRAAIVADEVLGKLSAALSSRNITWAKWKDAVQDAVDKTNNGGAGNAWFSYFKNGKSNTHVARTHEPLKLAGVQPQDAAPSQRRRTARRRSPRGRTTTTSSPTGSWFSGASGSSTATPWRTTPASRSASACRAGLARS